MEYSQTFGLLLQTATALRLNPYSNGILTDTIVKEQEYVCKSLNPYSNGILTDVKIFRNYVVLFMS